MVWVDLARAVTPSGDLLTLRQSGAEFEIRLNLFELMTSRNSVSERELARIACSRVARSAMHVLIGGLGMGYTVRSVLDEVDGDSQVTVAELVPDVVAWNRGPLADTAGGPLNDDRVRVFTGDVADLLRSSPGRFDAVLMDVDNGPEAVLFPSNAHLYSDEGVELVLSALRPGGVLALWAADRSPAFERVLGEGGFDAERIAVKIAGDESALEHSVYLVEAKSGYPVGLAGGRSEATPLPAVQIEREAVSPFVRV